MRNPILIEPVINTPFKLLKIVSGAGRFFNLN